MKLPLYTSIFIPNAVFSLMSNSHTHTQTPICRFYQWVVYTTTIFTPICRFMNDIEDMNEKVVEGILCMYKRGVSTTTIIPHLRHVDVTMT